MSVSVAPCTNGKPTTTRQRHRPTPPARVRTMEWHAVANRCYAVLEPLERELIHRIDLGREPARYIQPPRSLESIEGDFAAYQAAGHDYLTVLRKREAERHPEPTPPRPATPKPAPKPPAPIRPAADLDQVLLELQDRIARIEAAFTPSRELAELPSGGLGGHHAIERGI
jgi:hypothetical protein